MKLTLRGLFLITALCAVVFYVHVSVSPVSIPCAWCGRTCEYQPRFVYESFRLPDSLHIECAKYADFSNLPYSPPFRQTTEFQAIGTALMELPTSSPARVEAIKALLAIAEQIDRKHGVVLLVQEALAQLRLDIKYLTFDLEATRRERDEYKRRLDG